MGPTPWGTWPVRGDSFFLPGAILTHSLSILTRALLSFAMQWHRRTLWRRLLPKRGRRLQRRRKDLNSIAFHLGLSRPHSTLQQAHSCHIRQQRRRRSRSAPYRHCPHWNRLLLPAPPPNQPSSFRLYLRLLHSFLRMPIHRRRRPSCSSNKQPASAFRRLSSHRLRAKLLLLPNSTPASSSIPHSRFSSPEEEQEA